jgi:hypothetical protein
MPRIAAASPGGHSHWDASLVEQPEDPGGLQAGVGQVAEPHAEALGELAAVRLVLCGDERDLGAERLDLAVALGDRLRLGHAQRAPVAADDEPRHRPVQEVGAAQLAAVLEKRTPGIRAPTASRSATGRPNHG